MARTILSISLVIIGLLFTANQAAAVGVSVKPQRIVLELKAGQMATSQVLVTNVGSEPAVYQVYPDKFSDQISVSPTDFKLESQASQLVTLIVKTKAAFDLITNLSVVARPLAAGGGTAGSGVKVPVNVTVSGLSLFISLALLGLAVVISLLAIFMVNLKSRKSHRIFLK